MFHSTIGFLGHLSVIIACITALLASYGYINATFGKTHEISQWIRFSRLFFYTHSLAVLSIVVCLFIIIYNHYYEYYYAWSHSSNILPTHYMISCFWEGQEGSFLLWLFWHCVLGIVLIHTQKSWEAPMLSVFTMVQAFLASMILGVVIGDVKIGSSPFILLREYMPDAPIFLSNPEYIPKDGTGLNPLLQNYWMVIHPPTLFLGFASTLVPFSFCISGLYLKKYSDWVAPAFPWAIFSLLTLGLGILMGGYWAYETLNFGGYWNWDPVENAVYIPWLVMAACVHAMIIYKKNATALKTAILLSLSTFLLILYATFLTRSGILGNASVHSFTDLGLSGQLLIYMLFFVIISGSLIVCNWKSIPGKNSTWNIWKSDFWIFLGIATFCLAAFQILATTSIPVYNSVLSGLGISSNIALPADQVSHYSKFQIWFSIAMAALSGLAQFYYWHAVDRNLLQTKLYTPMVLTLVISTCIILLAKVNHLPYILLLLSSIFTLVCNGGFLIEKIRKAPKESGGAVAHMGLGFMLIGVLFSAGYSKIISKNTSGLLYSKEFSTEMNRDNVLLFRNQPVKMDSFTVVYKGPRIEVPGIPGFINKEQTYPTEFAYKSVMLEAYTHKGKEYLKKGDTITYQEENTYFEVLFTDHKGKSFTLYPRAQVNKEMGLLASPDIKKMFSKDIYAHVSSIPDPNETKEWSKPEIAEISIGDTIFVNDYFTVFESVKRIDEIQGIRLQDGDAAIKATFRVLDATQDQLIEPIFIVHNQMIGRIPAENVAVGARITLMQIEPKTSKFTIQTETSRKDWIILKTMEKPWIDIFWLGSILCMIGMCIALVKRAQSAQSHV